MCLVFIEIVAWLTFCPTRSLILNDFVGGTFIFNIFLFCDPFFDPHQ